MRISTTARCAGRRHGGKRILGGAVGIVASVALALAVAAPAWATVSATATLAPIGSGSYLVTVTNTGSEAITGFVVIPTGFIATNIVPSPTCQSVSSIVIRWITCTVTVAPAASTQMCYTGDALAGFVPGALWRVEDGTEGYVKTSPSPAVASCPLPGFIAGSGITVGGIAPGSSGTPALSGALVKKSTQSWSHALCKRTYKGWIKKHHHATRSQKKAEAKKLHKTHGCPLSILK